MYSGEKNSGFHFDGTLSIISFNLYLHNNLNVNKTTEFSNLNYVYVYNFFRYFLILPHVWAAWYVFNSFPLRAVKCRVRTGGSRMKKCCNKDIAFPRPWPVWPMVHTVSPECISRWCNNYPQKLLNLKNHHPGRNFERVLAVE